MLRNNFHNESHSPSCSRLRSRSRSVRSLAWASRAFAKRRTKTFNSWLAARASRITQREYPDGKFNIMQYLILYSIIVKTKTETTVWERPGAAHSNFRRSWFGVSTSSLFAHFDVSLSLCAFEFDDYRRPHAHTRHANAQFCGVRLIGETWCGLAAARIHPPPFFRAKLISQ